MKEQDRQKKVDQKGTEYNQKVQKIRQSIKSYHDFPKKGVIFNDIFGLVSNTEALRYSLEIFQEQILKRKVQFDKFILLELKGFLFGIPLSLKLNKPSYPIRKKGKLPGQKSSLKYKLQYGQDQIQIQKHSINKGDKVILVDDVLATGGTLNAAIQLVQSLGAVVEFVLLINVVKSCKGLDKLLVPREKVFYIYQN